MKKNRYAFLLSNLGVFVLTCVFISSCVVSDLYKIIQYNEQQKINLPDTFRLELPLIIDPVSGYFSIQARINNKYDESFIIDTKSPCLYKSEELEKMGANYRGIYPLAISNAYGQKHKDSLYYFDNFEISHISFGKPLFSSIDSTNKMYNVMYKNVIGTNILELLNWKFDLDNEKLILFDTNNIRLTKEIEGYTKFNKGLYYKKLKISFPQTDCLGSFTLDLGCQEEMLIDKKIFEKLRKIYPYREYHDNKENSLYVFSNINVQWGKLLVPNCYLIHRPSFSQNIIGSPFIQRFNFILNYRNPNTDCLTLDNLFIMPRKNFDTIKIAPPVSEFGFITSKQGQKVSYIEIDGVAQNAGLKLGDEILSINNGEFDLENSNKRDLIEYLMDKQNITIKVSRAGKTILIPMNIRN